MRKTLLNGINFGILLQLAIGPLCLMTFNTSMSKGFWPGMVVVSAIAVVDILYMLLAGVGVARLMKSESVQKKIKIFGCVVLVLFGLNILLNVFGISLLPDISIFPEDAGRNLFIKYVFLSASNPLTILFFSGVFSTQVIENHYTSRELFVFGVGIMISTLIFLTGVSAMGTVLSGFMPDIAINVLNFAVGIFLIYFGLRMYIKK
ncbi:MAG: lysine transporter LysE [Clostridia bacterium]|nr:lysine transporter LysE [Clostridia bacterium]